MLQHQRLCGIEGIVQAADVAVFHDEGTKALCKLKLVIRRELRIVQTVPELLAACHCKRTVHAKSLQFSQLFFHLPVRFLKLCIRVFDHRHNRRLLRRERHLILRGIRLIRLHRRIFPVHDTEIFHQAVTGKIKKLFFCPLF